MEQRSQLTAHLRDQETWLFRKYRIRFRVDRVTRDGQNALCSCFQSRRPIFQRPLPDHDLIDLTHGAVKALYLSGLRPMISIVPPELRSLFPPMDGSDPFHLNAALGAGEETIPASLR
ncbi:MAG TPA: hypothetical protein VKG92_01490 [Flavobacteriales bacterium]|nr:hypothetical protein [Flavobacteriales bacterium]